MPQIPMMGAAMAGRAHVAFEALGRCLAGCLLVALATLPGEAAHGPDATVLTMKAAYVKRRLDAGERLVLVDLRPEAEYRRGHLPGARSVPLETLPARYAEIPETGVVVLYCACPLEALRDAYLFLRGHSYRNITVMDDGFAAWVTRGYPLEP